MTSVGTLMASYGLAFLAAEGFAPYGRFPWARCHSDPGRAAGCASSARTGPRAANSPVALTVWRLPRRDEIRAVTRQDAALNAASAAS